jgi:hypothetical protein
MMTYLRLWHYLAEFFLERDMFYTIVVGKIKTRFMFNTFFPDNVEKCGSVRQTSDDNTILQVRIRFTCRMTKTHTLTIFSAYCLSTAKWLRERPHCYVIRTLPLFFAFILAVFHPALEAVSI